MTSWLLESLKSTHFSTFVSNMLWWNRSFLMFRHVFLTRQALAQFMAGKCRSELLNLRHAGVTAEVAQVHRGSRFWQRLGYHKSWEKCDLMGTTWQTYVFFEWLAIFKMNNFLLDEHRRFWSELESEMVWEGRSLVIFSSEYSGQWSFLLPTEVTSCWKTSSNHNSRKWARLYAFECSDMNEKNII